MVDKIELRTTHSKLPIYIAMDFIDNMIEKDEKIASIEFEQENSDGSKFKIGYKRKGDIFKEVFQKVAAVYEKVKNSK